MKRILSAAVMVATVLAGGTGYGVESRQQVTGTVTRAEKGQVEVKGADGKIVAVAVTAATAYTKGKDAAKLADVKPGVRVAVEAVKGKAGLEAVRIQIVVAEPFYTCPMHPEVKEAKPGKCPKCGMNLEKKG